MANPAPVPAWMQACALPLAWRGQAAWRVLDTDFAQGERFLQLWQVWAQDATPCPMLHLVALTGQAPGREALLQSLVGYPPLAGMAPELERQWFGFLPGFHQIILHGGRLRLTLGIGPVRALLREHQFSADSMVVGLSEPVADLTCGPTAASWDTWGMKALTRLCRCGTKLALMSQASLDPSSWQQAGFVADMPTLTGGNASSIWGGTYQPRWRTIRTRDAWRAAPAPVSHCVVIGAGLAGAAAANALALRGWQVTVLDAAQQPAAGASALPVGLLAPQPSRDDGPRSRLSRAGVRITLQAAHRLLQYGQDWALSGVAHCGNEPAALPPDGSEQARPWAQVGLAARRGQSGLIRKERADHILWHAAAGWIKPERMVRAWLDQPGIRHLAESPVHAIVWHAGQWRLIGPQGRVLADAPQLVIAAAGATSALVNMAMAAARATPTQPMAPLSSIEGQVSWAAHTEADTALFPRFPVNGAGSVVAHVPWESGSAWFAGATYENPTDGPMKAAQAHALNLERIAQLLPEAATAIAPAFAAAAVHAWRGTRWTAPDRLPIAGPWASANPTETPRLWISTAMGSRGLTYAALCGELIAAQMCAEPLPLEASLHKFISSERAQRQASRPARGR